MSSFRIVSVSEYSVAVDHEAPTPQASSPPRVATRVQVNTRKNASAEPPTTSKRDARRARSCGVDWFTAAGANLARHARMCQRRRRPVCGADLHCEVGSEASISSRPLRLEVDSRSFGNFGAVAQNHKSKVQGTAGSEPAAFHAVKSGRGAQIAR